MSILSAVSSDTAPSRSLVATLQQPAWRRRVALLLVVFPLSFVRGAGTLGYFSALVLGPFLALLALAAGVDIARGLRAGQGAAREDGGLLGAVARHGALELAWLCGLPLVVLLAGMAWNRNCDPVGGLWFYVAGPVACAVVGMAVGLWTATLFDRRRSVQLLLSALPVLASAALTLGRLYRWPMVFAYNPFLGWFSGPIYDEAVAVGPTYLWYRAMNGLLVIAALLVFDATVRRPGLRLVFPPEAGNRVRLGAALLCLVAGGSMALRPAAMGFATDRARTERALPGTRTTEHFVIHYAPGSATAREIDDVALEHEFAWARLHDILGVAPTGTIHSWVYPNPGVKKAVFGAGRVEVSLPWKREIYLRQLPYPHLIMHHELAHTFGGPTGDPLFGLSAGLKPAPTLNMGMVEGFANALAPRSSYGLDLHDQAAVLDRLKLRPPLDRVMGVGFFSLASRRAYTAAGSFAAWLHETRGIGPLKQVYRSAGDFEAAYGEPLGELEADWLTFLRARPLRDEDLEAMKQRFRRRSVFARPCAHRSAVLAGQARAALGRGDRETAIEGWETLCTIEPEQVNHRINLAATLATLGELDRSLEVLDEAAGYDDLTHALLSSIESTQGDVALIKGDWDAARQAYDLALTRASSQGKVRSLQIKRRAADDPAVATLVTDYFALFERDTGSYAAGVARSYVATRLAARPGWAAVGDYLVARQLLNAARPSEAIPHLRAALSPPGDEPKLPSWELRRAARLALVQALVQTRDFDGARRILDELDADPDAGTGDALDAGWWRERADYYERYLATHPEFAK